MPDFTVFSDPGRSANVSPGLHNGSLSQENILPDHRFPHPFTLRALRQVFLQIRGDPGQNVPDLLHRFKKLFVALPQQVEKIPHTGSHALHFFNPARSGPGSQVFR